MTEKLYTEQEVKIMIIDNNLTSLTNTVSRMEERIHVFQYWMLGLMIGLYGVIIAAYFMK